MTSQQYQGEYAGTYRYDGAYASTAPVSSSYLSTGFKVAPYSAGMSPMPVGQKYDGDAPNDFACRFSTFVFLFLASCGVVAAFVHFWAELGTVYNFSHNDRIHHEFMGGAFFTLFVLVILGMSTFLCLGGTFSYRTGFFSSGIRWSIYFFVLLLSAGATGIFLHFWTDMEYASTDLKWPSRTYQSSITGEKFQELLKDADVNGNGLSKKEFKALSAAVIHEEKGDELTLENKHVKVLENNDLDAVFYQLDRDQDGLLNEEESAHLESLAEGGSIDVDAGFLHGDLDLAKNNVFVAFFALVFIQLLVLIIVMSFWNGSKGEDGRNVHFYTSDPSRWMSFCFLLVLIVAGVGLLIYVFVHDSGPKFTTTKLYPDSEDKVCVEGYWNWQQLWTPERQHYCCLKLERACPDQTVYKTRIVHAPPPKRQVIYKERQVEVPVHEKVVKYRYEGVPAPSPPREVEYRYKYKYVYKTTVPFDCDAGWSGGRWKTGWSHAKREWCCEHEERGCYRWNCDRGWENWFHEWGHDKKEWCCENRNRGCGLPTTSLPFDCSAGQHNCWHGWSKGKKEWCCSVQPDATPSECCHKPQKPSQTCKLWGDPHIITFDKSHLVFYSEGDFWIVKSPDLKIQGRFQATQWTKDNDHTDYSSMTSIIFSGHKMHGNKLEVRSMEGDIRCNGHQILKGFGEDNCGPATITFDSKGKLVDSAMSFLPHNVVHVELPNGEWIQVNRWPNFINALVSMHEGSNQDGVCGNFNGVHSDDTGVELHRRFGHGVERFEDLFDDFLPVHFPQAKPSAKRCTAKDMHEAERTCQHRVASARDGWSFAECMGDYCDKFKEGGSYQAQVWKEHHFHHLE